MAAVNNSRQIIGITNIHIEKQSFYTLLSDPFKLLYKNIPLMNGNYGGGLNITSNTWETPGCTLWVIIVTLLFEM